VKLASVKNFFGLTPGVGDKVTGYTDWSVQITGTITEIIPILNYAKVAGTVTISTDWNGIIEEQTDGDYVPISRLRFA